MIGSGLTRFEPYNPQDGGDVLGLAWRLLRSQGPTMLKQVLGDTVMAGLKGGASRGGFNVTRGVSAAKRGANRAVKRRARQALQREVVKKVKRDLFGLR